jgi:hypothetical protein
MGNYLISAHLYYTICVLQTWVLGFWHHHGWKVTEHQVNLLELLTVSMHLELEGISWYSIKIRKICQYQPR